jgi:Domain of unknown function (DUF5679)
VDVKEAYCVRCKDKREMDNPVVRTADSGRRVLQGLCPVCGFKMNRILRAEDAVLTESSDPYHTITIASYIDGLDWPELPHLNWYSIFGDGTSKTLVKPHKPKLRRRFWHWVHKKAEEHNACYEGGW